MTEVVIRYRWQTSPSLEAKVCEKGVALFRRNGLLSKRCQMTHGVSITVLEPVVLDAGSKVTRIGNLISTGSNPPSMSVHYLSFANLGPWPRRMIIDGLLSDSSIITLSHREYSPRRVTAVERSFYAVLGDGKGTTVVTEYGTSCISLWMTQLYGHTEPAGRC